MTKNKSINCVNCSLKTSEVDSRAVEFALVCAKCWLKMYNKMNMKLKITYPDGTTRQITDNLNKEQLNSLCQHISNGYVGTNKNFSFNFQKIEITK